VRELFLGGFSDEILVVAFDVGELEAIELRAHRQRGRENSLGLPLFAAAAEYACSMTCAHAE
jgi:hypothetical protein